MKKTPTTHPLTNITPELYKAIAKDKGSRYPVVSKNTVILEALNSYYGLNKEVKNDEEKQNS